MCIGLRPFRTSKITALEVEQSEANWYTYTVTGVLYNAVCLKHLWRSTVPSEIYLTEENPVCTIDFRHGDFGFNCILKNNLVTF
jgi:hypothetical protein